MLLGFAILFGIGGAAFLIYQKVFKSAQQILVSFSEIIGDTEVEHSVVYTATIDGMSYKIPGLNIERPLPPSDCYIHTNGNKKKVRLVRTGINRYVYRVPVKNGEVYVYKKDNDGKIIKENGKVKVTKNQWKICDDYIEQNVKHWERLRNKEIEEKHRIQSKMAEWRPLMVMGVIFIFAIIALKITSDTVKHNTAILAGKIDEINENSNRLLDSITGFVDSKTGVTRAENENPQQTQEGSG